MADDIKDSNVPIDLMPAEQLNRLKEAFSILGELTRGKVLERIEKLEDTKRMFDELTVSRLDDHWKRIEKLESKEKYLDIRIIEQEQESSYKKVIDKQAWEYIKSIVSDIYDTSSLNAVHPYRLVEAIKKIDTDWEPMISKK